jgi:hypothetical protein
MLGKVCFKEGIAHSMRNEHAISVGGLNLDLCSPDRNSLQSRRADVILNVEEGCIIERFNKPFDGGDLRMGFVFFT